MYRRKKQVEKKEEPKQQPHPKSEPVIAKIVPPLRGEGIVSYGKVPMVNVLRDIEYFSVATGHSVTFEKMIDIAFSEGYLNVDQSGWYIDNNLSWGSVYQPGDPNAEPAVAEKAGAFRDTTDYTRSTFMCGDVIFTRDANKSFAFLITKVYSNYIGEGMENDVQSVLQYKPPNGTGEDDNDLENSYLSSFSLCNGDVYMFTRNAQFKDIKAYVSKDTNKNSEYRVLHPSNVSVHKGETTNTNFTAGKGAAPTTKVPDDYPKKNDVPLEDADEAGHFNLTNGTVVEGWFIYMKSEAEEANQTAANITGDIVRTGPIVIAKIGNSISIGNSMRLSHGTTTVSASLYYDGNDTKLASEPLNSEHYQKNYGDAVGSKSYVLTDLRIFSLKAIMDYAEAAESATTPAQDP